MLQVLVGCVPGPARRCTAGWLVLSRTQLGRDGAVAPTGGAMMDQDGILKALKNSPTFGTRTGRLGVARRGGSYCREPNRVGMEL
jgi:hypothetical protein